MKKLFMIGGTGLMMILSLTGSLQIQHGVVSGSAVAAESIRLVQGMMVAALQDTGEAYEGQLYEYVMGVEWDPPSEDQICIWPEELPEGAQFPECICGPGHICDTLKWIPTYCQAGVYRVVFNAGENCSFPLATFPHYIHVHNVNRSPVVETELVSMTLVGGETCSLSIVATDLDMDECGDDDISLAGTIEPEPALQPTFIDSGGGRGSFEWITTSEDIGTYAITFLAGDLYGEYGEKTITVEVTGPPLDHGDPDISDPNEDFSNKGFYSYEDVIGCPTCGPCTKGVNVVTGELIVQQPDVSISSFGPDLDGTFTYNSGSFFNSRYGFGWQPSFNMRYITNDLNENVIVVREDDRRDIFVKQPDGFFESTYGVQDSLIEYAPQKYALILKDGTKYWFESDDHHYVTRIEDLNGNTLSYSYTADKQLTGITDASGRELHFAYSGNKLVRMTDPTGRDWHYEYDDNDNLVRITDPEGGTTEYTYNDCHDLTGITDPEGNTRSIEWDDDYRVSKITTGCCGEERYFYDLTSKKRAGVESNTRATIVVDANNHKTTYYYDEKNRVIALKDALGNTTYRTWDNDYNMTSLTDANGHTTTYEYDSKGNLIRETDALGNATEYTYDLRFNKVTSMTDALGRTTTYTYDGQGNMLTETDPLGHTTTYTYDDLGQMTSRTDSRGNTTTYEYDEDGNLIRITDPSGYSTTSTYDDVGNKTSETDANGNTTYYEYDDLDRLTRITDPLGCETTYEYDAFGNRVSKTDGNGNTTTYGYDEFNRLIRITDALGYVTGHEYDPVGNQISVTDANGHTTTYGYDALNRQIMVTDALGCVTYYGHDPVGNKISETDANGYTTTSQYDEINRHVLTTDPLGCVTSYSYDAVGNQVSITDANGKVTYYKYDEADKPIKIIRKVGDIADIIDDDDAVTEYEYDEVGNRTTEIDPNGNRTEYEYNERNDLIRETNPEGEVTSYTYDSMGKRKTETMPNGNVITYVYDANNRLVNTSDLIGLVASYSYDCMGNMITITDGSGNVYTNTFDNLDRLVGVTDPLAKISSYSYDAVGNLLQSTDREGNTTTYSYDSVNRRISITDALGGVTSYAYDAAGNLVRITDANSNTTIYDYDGGNRLIRETFADGTTKEFTYDCVGMLLTRRDQNGNTTTFLYDDLYNLSLRDYPGLNDDIFTYDRAGRMLTADNSDASISFTYDNAGRVLTESLNDKTTSYTYNISLRKMAVTYPGGRIITENTDPRERLTKVTNSLGQTIVDYAYDLGDRVTSRAYSNGITESYTYDANNWVTSLIHSDGVAQFNYALDNVGNKLYQEKVHRPSNSEKYNYDKIYRLTAYKEGTLVGGDIPSPLTKTQYSYDGVGNRTTTDEDGTITTYAVNTVNEYTSIVNGGVMVSVNDDNGNLIDDGMYTFTYDYENRLLRVTKKEGNLLIAEYNFDPFGRRIEKSVDINEDGILDVITRYFFDGVRVVEERNGADAVTATYVYGNRIDEVLTMDRGSATYHYHENSLGSIVAITNSTGTVVERYEYDGYGEVTIYDPNWTVRASSTIDNSYTFTGREYDPETGLYYYRARYYTPVHGRFIQRDPLGYEGGDINLYTYVFNAPTKFTDPEGLQTIAVGFKTITNPTWGTCGKFTWKVRWYITNKVGKTVQPLARATESWIIQNMVNKFDIKNCAGATVDNSTVKLYEAWRVGKDGWATSKYEYDFNGDGTIQANEKIDYTYDDASDDDWLAPSRPKTCGTWTYDGFVYWKSSIGKGELTPGAVGMAGILPASTTKPKNLGDWTLYRHAEATWNCCPPKSTSSGKASAKNKWGTYTESWTSAGVHKKTVTSKKKP